MALSHPASNSCLQESPDYRGARTDAAEGGDLAALERDKTDVRRRGAAWVKATNGADVVRVVLWFGSVKDYWSACL